ncbi:hypothetical protein K1T71_010772 [Dendrolimus kikuchii]|uniref:Uncharacterized protein n=1 Tax=Dendrolimus kikuchii TaxID=765133 RepID=A0ACC1CQ14_9NEOP|nr:hypothetical protein K1T71_010772 [Dendrolimus kikuchii]
MIHKWWHRFVRKRTKPIPGDVALLWKRRLSLAYGFFAWNAFGFVIYSFYKGKADWAQYYGLKSEEEVAMRPGQSWANTLGIKNAKVYRISGISKVDEYDIVDGKMVKEISKSEEFDG